MNNLPKHSQTYDIWWKINNSKVTRVGYDEVSKSFIDDYGWEYKLTDVEKWELIQKIKED